MTLSVLIIDKKEQTLINEEQPNVLIDDTISMMKEKLFALTNGISWYPGFTKVETRIDNKYNVIQDNNSILFYFNVIPQEPRLYVSNIVNEISTLYEISDLMGALDTERFDEIYKELKKDYLDLSEDDLEFVIKLTLFHVNNILYSAYEQDIDNYVQRLVAKKHTERHIEIEEQLEELYRYAYNIQDYSKYFAIDDSGVPKFNYSGLTLVIKGENFENGVKGRFIKLDKVFNILELDEFVPLVAYKADTNDVPTVKVYNRLAETVPEKEIRSWILNEKKKLNLLSFKKVKGLLIKSKLADNVYLSITLLNNGLITAKVVFPDGETHSDVQEVMRMINSGVDAVVDKINSLQGVFTQSRRLQNTSQSVVVLDSVSGSASTQFRVHRGDFRTTLANDTFRDSLFEVKETISQDVLSVYYKKYGKREFEDTEAERKGITVNIRDNPYKLDSSIINIYGAYHINQITSILKQLVIVSLISTSGSFQEEEVQKLKEKSHIKNLRKQFGVHIDSKKCQKRKQPEVNSDSKPHVGSYVLDYKGLKFVCPNSNVPYPGFINDNSICCFEKDQRRRDVYIRNTKGSDFDIMVQPSNFLVEVSDPASKTKFKTYVIKVVSDYIDGFNETNAMSRYYYLSDTGDLMPIRSEVLIKKLKKEESRHGGNIWLGEVPLAKIITGPPKNKCNSPPDMNKRDNNDINAPCKHHKKNKTFGYSLNSYPCCFDSERKVQVERKMKSFDITKQYIITSDKILDYQRLGVLPPGLDKLFNEVVAPRGGKYYRMGVTQNNSAFLNAVLLAIGNRLDDKRLSNANELKMLIAEHLKNNPGEFKKLNDGNIALKYGTLNNFIDGLLDTNKTVYWYDVVDILQRILKANVMVLDIPYKMSELTKLPDYENVRIACHPHVKVNKTSPFIFIVKRLNTFEVIVLLKNTDTDKADLKMTFGMSRSPSADNTTNIVNLLLNYHSSSCVKENVFPEGFPYAEMFTGAEVVELLKSTQYEVIAQIVNEFGKVDYAMTRQGILIPIKEGGIQNGLRTLTLEQLKKAGKLLGIDKYLLGIKKLGKIFKSKTGRTISVLGVTVDKKDDIYVTSGLTNFGQLVPVQQSVFMPDSSLQVLPFKYYPDINKALKSSGTTENEQQEYYDYVQELRALIFKVKTELAAEISNDNEKKDTIQLINKDPTKTRHEKINQLVSIFKQTRINTTKDTNTMDFVLASIANDVLNDNVENLLLNNLVTAEVFNPNEVVKRDVESVLTSIDDIVRWLKQYKGEAGN